MLQINTVIMCILDASWNVTARGTYIRTCLSVSVVVGKLKSVLSCEQARATLNLFNVFKLFGRQNE